MKISIAYGLMVGAMSLLAALPIFAQPQSQRFNINTPELKAEHLAGQLLRQLAKQQYDDGSWGYSSQTSRRASEATRHNHRVGTTGLAVMAFLGQGSTMSKGYFRPNVRNGIKWLRDVQSMHTGLFSNPDGEGALVAHAIATIAMAEAYYFDKSPLLKRNARKASTAIFNSQVPYQAWRRMPSATGACDVMTTSWMVHALITIQDCNITVPDTSLYSGIDWLVSQPGTDASSRWLFLQLLRPKPEFAEAAGCHHLASYMQTRVDQIRRNPPKLNHPESDAHLEQGYFLSQAIHHWGNPNWHDHHRDTILRHHRGQKPTIFHLLPARTLAL